VLCLRLATLLCHARNDLPEGVVSLRRRDDEARLAINADWAEGHPRTMHLLTEEARAWERAGPLRLLIERS
jgi:exopolyphosphatase/guanosine-5'-triphosphate,3'-diphosphate pyrophosphatase